MQTKLIKGLLFLFLISAPTHFLFANPSDKANLITSTKTGYSLSVINSGFFAEPITICSGASIVIKGDTETPVPTSYSWQVLQGASTWVAAPGVTNGPDYTPNLLINNTSSDVVFSIRRLVVISGITSYDSFFDVTVLPSAPITNNSITAPAVTSFCSPGNPAAITGSAPAGGTGTYTFKWQSSTDNVNFTDIAGANLSNYTPTGLTTTTYFHRTTNGGSCATPTISNTVTITIYPVVTNNVITAPTVNSFCSASDPAAIAGNTPSGGSGTYTYQWQQSTDNVNFTDIPTATNINYDPATLSVTTYYRRSAVSGLCSAPVFSNVVTISILTPLTNNVVTAPAVTNLCVSGDPANISGNTPTGGNGTYAYQWQQSTDNITFTNIGGATSINYDPGTISTTTYYRRTATSGACATPLMSNVVTIAVATLTPITNNTLAAPAVTSFCSPGSPAAFTGSTPAGATTFTYQWQSSTDNVTFADISGATSANYTPGPLTVTTYFRRVTSGSGCVTPSTSNAITITISPVVTNNVITAPTVSSFCSASDPAVITGNTPSGGSGTYTYQWQQSTDNATFTDIAGATGISYDPATISVTTYYRRSAVSGPCATPVYSNVATISILPALANNVITAPIVSTFCVTGDPANISGSTPTGGNGTYAYQWQQSTDNVTFTNIPGATATDYDPGVLNTPTYYRRTVTSGSCATPQISNVVTINVTPVTPLSNNTLTAPAVSSFCSPGGSPAAITGSTPAGAGTFTYQWQTSTDNVTFTDISGATSINYTPPALTATTYYRRTASGGTCATPSTSNVITITVSSAVSNNVITAPAVNSFCLASDPAAITGNTPSGGSGTYTYQWQTSSDGVTFTDIAGATTKDYDPAVIAATTYYRRSAISGGCSVPGYSNVVTISILPVMANNVITAPAVTTFCVTGDPANISGNTPTGGTGTYAYQWQQSTDNVNFTNIPGATTTDYDPGVISAPTYYRRTITSGQCTTPAVSNVVTISLVPFPATPVPTQPAVTVCPGSSATLSVSSPQAGFTYNWYDSATKTNLLFTGSLYVTAPLTSNKTFYVESSNGFCPSASLAPVQVTMNVPPLSPALDNNTINICSGSVATFNVTSPPPNTTYNWYATLTGGTSMGTGASFTTPAISANTTYYAEAMNAQGCVSLVRTPANTTITPVPQFTVQGASVCPGSDATLTAATAEQNITFNWYANATGGAPVFTGNTFLVSALTTAASYYAEATNGLTGCVAPRQLVQAQLLQQLPAPVVTAGAVTATSVTFNWAAVAGATGYQASIDNGQSYTAPSSGSNGLSHTVSGLQVNQSVTILVKATGASTCELSDNSNAVSATAQSQTDDIYVPNAFTPNGDGKNDIVYVHSEGIKTLSFYIYDQWGELLFTSTDVLTGWDGTFKGTRQPLGVYVYFLKAVMNNGHELNKKGTITLLK